MEMHNILKQTRLNKGYTINQLSEITKIKPRSLNQYENGDNELYSLNKCIVLFNALDLNVVEVYNDVFQYQEECDNNIKKWYEAHPRDYNYKSLKKHCYERIYHLKYHNIVSDNQYNKILSCYKNVFNNLSLCLEDRLLLTPAEYENEYLNFLYNVKHLMYYKELDRAYDIVLSAYLRSEFSSVTFGFIPDDFINLINYTNKPKFRKILSGELKLDNLSIVPVLKLCYVLELDFNKIFLDKK